MDVVLPCLDEAGAIPTVLAAIPVGWRIIVVDNGSRDESARIAADLGARVVFEPRRGYGAAVHAGLMAARSEYVAVMDCDGSLDPAELPALLQEVRSGRADLVCGRRRPVRRGVWAWHARCGNRVLASLVSRGAKVRLHDIAPVRIARRADLIDLQVADRRCGYPLETLQNAAQRGWRIIEMDVSLRPRANGTRSKISGTVRGTATVVWDFIHVLVRRRRGVIGPALQRRNPADGAPLERRVSR